MLINQIINVEIISGDSPPVTEPVGLAEMKDYLRLQGFVSNEDSPADEFDFDDDLIEDMITEARIWAEQFIGGDNRMHMIMPRDIEVVAQNEAGGIKIPGPVRGAIVSVDDNDTTIDPVIVGTVFPKVDTAYCNPITLSYSAGYTTFPAWVKNAIKAYVAFAYENRGDEQVKSPERAAAILRPYRKINAFG